MPVDSGVAQDLVVGWHRTGWKVAQYQPRWGTADDGDLVVLGV